ncbi:hypothetical protein CIB48_g3109 [Xylaria polymorpha]|nr:hypothetical protein CIB48_g3109 [Xylaria polymorpha]
MSRRRSDDDDLAYGERWDHDRLAYEKDRFEERDRYYARAPTRERVREASVDERFVERRAPRPWEDNHVRERKYYDEAPPRHRSPSPDLERSIYLEKERDREYRDPPPVRRPPGLLRRQSSLDTFDRRPAQRLYDHDEYEPPARPRDYRPEPYEPIPLPRSRALPPPRMYAEYDYEEIKVADPQPRQRRGRSHRGSSRSTRSSSTSSSSDTGGTAITTKSEYPKKGKTRIPVRLISIRAIVELQYPYIVEGNTVIIQKALGQQNIDDLLRLSDEYKKADAEITSARSVSAALVEERKEEVFTLPPPAPPTLIRAPPPLPRRSCQGDDGPHGTSRMPVVIDAGPREVIDNTLVGPLAIVGDRRDHHHHHGHHSHSRDRDLVRAERLPTGELVLYEEEIERIEEPRRGVRIEKDKKGPPPKLMRAMLATLT